MNWFKRLFSGEKLTPEQKVQIRSEYKAMKSAIDEEVANTMIYPGEDAAFKIAMTMRVLNTERTKQLCVKHGVTEAILKEILQDKR
jgi:hypothetical protein